ncbi:MAG: MazG nucleotide pyrophosphohydrolase [Parcubacteria bacterium C7867-004]|nr:MAG: MazG nucleotide pyrophosphohydrolase [Parcubacteria bacterium C7867-004]
MLKDTQKQIDEWAQTLEEPYWPPLSQFAALSEEVGEVGRLMNHLYGSKPKKVEEANQELGGEIVDVIFAAMCMANRHGIDLDAEFEKKMDKCYWRDRDRFAKKDHA